MTLGAGQWRRSTPRLGVAYLVGSALTHAELVPALVMISV
jgi:hypothetical protein